MHLAYLQNVKNEVIKLQKWFSAREKSFYFMRATDAQISLRVRAV